MTEQAWTVDFMREEALALAAPFSPASESFSALMRAADALQEAAAAMRRHQARQDGSCMIVALDRLPRRP